MITWMRSQRFRTVQAFLLFLLLGGFLSLDRASADAMWLVSQGNPSVTPVAGSEPSLMTPDGRFVVIRSASPFLVPGVFDSNGVDDAFLLDRTTGGLTLISHAFGSSTQTSNGRAIATGISDDGAYVAFESTATNLLPPQAGTPGWQVYLWERATSSITLVSHAPGLPMKWDPSGADAHAAALSADGRYLTFTSASPTLVPYVVYQALGNVFSWDRTTGEVVLVSRAPGSSPGYSGNQESFGGAMSADGRFVVFGSTSSNLLAGWTDNLGKLDAFLWDRQSGALTLISHAPGLLMTAANGNSLPATISADGQFVAFRSDAWDLPPLVPAFPYAETYLWARATGAITLVSHTLGNPNIAASDISLPGGISSDGRFVAFLSVAPDLLPSPALSGSFFLHLWDRTNGSISLVSHAPGAPTTPITSSRGVLSADGSTIVFGSEFVTWDDPTPQRSPVYAWQRSTGEVRLVSHAASSNSTPANEGASARAISGDGRIVAFVSRAKDLLSSGAVSGEVDNSYFWDSSNGEVTLAVRRPDGPTGRGGGVASMSADGRFVAFTSPADDGTGAHSDAYLWDRVTRTTALISHAAGNPTQPANGRSVAGVMSEDGAFVTFTSNAGDLMPGQQYGGLSVAYVWERSTGLVTMVSHRPGSPTQWTWERASPVAITPDGAYILFTSPTIDLVAGGWDPNQDDDVFLWERATGTVTLVSHAWGAPLVAAEKKSYASCMSADGRFVLFNSYARNLTPDGDPDIGADAFLWDRSTGIVTLVSHQAASLTLSGWGWGSSISRDGEFVAFGSNGSSLVPGEWNGNNHSNAYLWQRSTGVVTLISHAPGAPAISGNGDSGTVAMSPDGSYVVVTTSADLLAQGLPSGLVIWERATGQWTTMPNAGLVAVTPDMQHALFESYATNLVTGQVDANGERDAFIWDRSTGTMALVSHAARGAAITGDRGVVPAAPVALSGDGRFVAFSSPAMDLVTGEYWPRAANAYLWFAGVGAAPAFTSPTAATMIAHAANHFSVSASGAPPPSLMPANPLPPGLSLIDHGDGTADLAGSPATGTGGIHALSFRAANGLDPDAMQSFTLTVDEAPRITSGSSGSFIPGTPGAIDITTAAYPTATLAQTGALPDGLSFVDHGNGTATIAGTAAPGTFGRYPIQITAQNGFAPDASQGFVITVDTGMFNTLAPCRVFDSRLDGPALASGATRVVQLAGKCGIPATARSVSLNVTVVAAGSGGFLQAFAGDESSTTVSTVNFTANRTRANNAFVQLALDGRGTLALRPYLPEGGSVDVVLDVNGYFE